MAYFRGCYTRTAETGLGGPVVGQVALATVRADDL